MIYCPTLVYTERAFKNTNLCVRDVFSVALSYKAVIAGTLPTSIEHDIACSGLNYYYLFAILQFTSLLAHQEVISF